MVNLTHPRRTRTPTPQFFLSFRIRLPHTHDVLDLRLIRQATEADAVARRALAVRAASPVAGRRRAVGRPLHDLRARESLNLNFARSHLLHFRLARAEELDVARADGAAMQRQRL